MLPHMLPTVHSAGITKINMAHVLKQQGRKTVIIKVLCLGFLIYKIKRVVIASCMQGYGETF